MCWSVWTIEQGWPGLAAARLEADRRLWMLGKPYLLRDVYEEVARVLSFDEGRADRLMDLEIELEHEEVIPVAEILTLVKDGTC